MDIQRLRNLTTGILHTKMADIYEDLDSLTRNGGIMTHMIPRVMRAIEPWLREKVTDERFWNGIHDPSHQGDFPLPCMTEDESCRWCSCNKAMIDDRRTEAEMEADGQFPRRVRSRSR